MFYVIIRGRGGRKEGKYVRGIYMFDFFIKWEGTKVFSAHLLFAAYRSSKNNLNKDLFKWLFGQISDIFLLN